MVAEAINIDVKKYPVVGNKWDVSFRINWNGEQTLTPKFKSILNFTEASDGRYWIVYATRNLINDKWYVGQHVTDNMDDNYLGSGVILNKAIKKYGKQNFKTRFCCFCEDQENLDRAEIAYIKYFDSRNSDTGYNLAFGGGGGDTLTGHPNIKEISKKMSESAIGKVISEEAKLKMSISRTGKTHLEEVKRKISVSSKNREKLTCPHCGMVGGINVMKTYHFENCIKNPKYTKKDIEEINKSRKQKLTTCSWCGEVGGIHAMNQWHFDNCKKNPNFKPKEKELIKCPHCEKSSTHKGNMTRFHFDNCKFKKDV